MMTIILLIMIILLLNLMYRNYNAMCKKFLSLVRQSVLANANREINKLFT